MDLVVSQSEICLRDGEYCGTIFNISKTPCCGSLNCAMDAPHPALCSDCTLRCLDCKTWSGLCGGPNNIKCCPGFECVLKDKNDKISSGKCQHYP